MKWAEAPLYAAALRAPPGRELEALRGAVPIAIPSRAEMSALVERWRTWPTNDASVVDALAPLAFVGDAIAIDDNDPSAPVLEVARVLGDDTLFGPVTGDDAPAMIALLATEPGGEDDAWRAWIAHWDARDPLARLDRLAAGQTALPVSRIEATRRRLRALVTEWGELALSTAELLAEVDYFVADHGAPALPADHPTAAVPVVLAHLRNLPRNLCTRDDVPAILALLDAPAPGARAALSRFFGYVRTIESDARLAAVVGLADYEPAELRRMLRWRRLAASRRLGAHAPPQEDV
jgi:hypothetical protein